MLYNLRRQTDKFSDQYQNETKGRDKEFENEQKLYFENKSMKQMQTEHEQLQHDKKTQQNHTIIETGQSQIKNKNKQQLSQEKINETHQQNTFQRHTPESRKSSTKSQFQPQIPYSNYQNMNQDTQSALNLDKFSPPPVKQHHSSQVANAQNIGLQNSIFGPSEASTPQHFSAKKRQDRPKLLLQIGTLDQQYAEGETPISNNIENKEPNMDKIQQFIQMNRDNNSFLIQASNTKRTSISSMFRFSNKLKRPSVKAPQEQMRGSNGKFMMMPSIKSIANIKSSMKVTENVKEKFLKLLGKSSVPIELSQHHSSLSNNLIIDISQRRDDISITGPETQFGNNITYVQNSNLKENSRRQNEVIRVDQFINRSEKNYSLLSSKEVSNPSSLNVQSPQISEKKYSDLIKKFDSNLKQHQESKITQQIPRASILKNKVQSPLQNIKLDPNEPPQQIERSKCFAFNYRPKEGCFIYATKLIRDQDLFEFLLTVQDENIAKFSITNAELTDTGIVLLSHFFQHKQNLHVLKLYNNIMNFILNSPDKELPYLTIGTADLAQCLKLNTRLTSLELHGFFFHQPDFPLVIDALLNCHSLKNLQFSNNDIQDFGVKHLCRLLETQNYENKIELEQLTIYNNNITDIGAQEIARVMKGNPHIKILNLQMNYIKDTGGQSFFEGIQSKQYPQIWKIILLDNKCTEDFKKRVKKTDIIII
eukprot:403369370